MAPVGDELDLNGVEISLNVGMGHPVLAKISVIGSQENCTLCKSASAFTTGKVNALFENQAVFVLGLSMRRCAAFQQSLLREILSQLARRYLQGLGKKLVSEFT